jgi:Uma2 family endonuclease
MSQGTLAASPPADELSLEEWFALPEDAPGEKLVDYAAFGVAWYWLLDPQLRSLEILELDGQGRYLHALGASSGTLEKVPGCEGLRLDLDALWAAIDALE